MSANGAITIYNQDNPPSATGLPSGGWGSYRGFSASFSDASFSVAYTDEDTAPLPATIYLTELSLRHSGSQGGTTTEEGDWTNAIIKVYSSAAPTTGTFVGDSLATVDMSHSGSERNVTFSFSNLALDPSETYWFYFANTAGNAEPDLIQWTNGRLRVSNDPEHTYSSGNLFGSNFGGATTAYDAVFSATFSSVPEPSAALLGGVGALALLRRRRS